MRHAGKKIIVSGGSRCNVLPEEVDLQTDFVTESKPAALRAVFASWSLEECRHWLEQDVGLPLALEAETRKFFPANGSERAADRVVLALGGSSFPKMGTDGTGFRVLRALGHTLRPPYPALTPLKGAHPAGSQLAGLAAYEAQLESVPVRTPDGDSATPGGGGGGGRRKRGARRAARRSLLFTHRGFSGPGVLDLSHTFTMAAERGGAPPELRVAWTPDGAAAWDTRLQAPAGAESVAARLRRGGVPARLADALCSEIGLEGGARMAALRREQRIALVRALTAYALPIAGHEGYAKAEVTGGGLPLDEVDCSTLESRLRPGLFVCGELLDVFGRIGGFNFYWAWVTGRLAGLAAGKPLARGVQEDMMMQRDISNKPSYPL
ncbi:hypothetical protein WJX81_003628 [Elliptochloris bilobata]|uniref:Aminoacetone oxidase family FAD-binding enzyme n=1 Tax=Elliptochloris bilobata TaxID=381761 RepID=A0AAW1QJS8_9CHLO